MDSRDNTITRETLRKFLMSQLLVVVKKRALHWRNHGFEKRGKKKKRYVAYANEASCFLAEKWTRGSRTRRNFPGYFSKQNDSPAKSRKLILNLVYPRVSFGGISCSFNLRDRIELKKKKNDISSPFLLIASERERERTASFIYHRRSFYFRRGIYIIAFPQTRRHLSPKIFITAYRYYSRIRDRVRQNATAYK